MVEKNEFSNNPEVQAALNTVLVLLEKNPVIQDFHKITKKIEAHPTLFDLTEKIKVEQKNAVKFAHYGKPEAEKMALQEADRLTKEFDEHPLVIRYRESLIEANDLLQHLTKKIERDFNEQLEETLAEVVSVEKDEKENQ